jgi:hypothetical protein
MISPKISRPIFPEGYLSNPTSHVTWEYVVQRLTESKNYWMSSVRPNRKPHVVPRWGVFVEDRFYYDGSPETVHARNIVLNPHVVLHLESGDQAVIVEGLTVAVGKPAKELAEKVARAFRAKYSPYGYSPQANQWDSGGLYALTPHKALAWTNFIEDPTRFDLSGD